MHLVIVTPFPPAITGIGQYGYHVTRALATSGAFERVTVLAGSQVNGTKPNALVLTEIEYCWAHGQLNARQAILSRVKRLNPDLVWFNLRVGMFGESPWMSVSGLLTPMFTRWMRYPTVVTFHEMVELSDFHMLKAPGGPLAPLGARWVTSIATKADVVCLTMQKHIDWFAKIGERTAENIKIQIGNAYPFEEEKSMEIKGRDLVAGAPKTIEITSSQVNDALMDPLSEVVDAVRTALEKTPPELASDIVDNGIVLTGGGALLANLDVLLRERTGLPCFNS